MATGRSSRVKMRSRPIDVNRALFISDTSQREPDDHEIEQALAAIPGGAAAHGGHGGGHGHSGHTGQGDGMIAGVGIPTPPIYIDYDYHKRLDYGRFIQPSAYIKAHQTGGTGLINSLDRYDLLREDIEWLAAYNAAAEAKRPPGQTMTEDDMEKMIDLFEKEAGKITLNGMRAEMMSIEDKIDPRKEFPLVRAIVVAATTIHVRTKILEPVYEYWIDKRKRLGKALMRQYQEPPPRGNVDPHVAFRPRTEGRRISKRNPRKDDHSGYHKMIYLKRDFQKLLDIIDHTLTREQLKREGALLGAHIFDARLQATPWGQKMLRENPNVATAIAQQNAQPPPASGMVGLQVPALPSILAGAPQETMQMYRLLNSCQPPCTYSRQELEAEGRRRRAQTQHARASAAASGGGGGGGGQKRSNNVISIRRPDRAQSGGGGHHGHSSEARAREKEARKAARREYALSLGALAPLEEEPEEMEITDEEDLLSEDEADIKFYEEVEAHVKRMKIERAANSADASPQTDAAVKLEPFGSYASYASYPASLASGAASVTPAASAAPSALAPPRHIPPGAKVGFLSGVVGRGNLVWLEATYQHVTAAQQHAYLQQLHAQQLQHQQAHAHQHAQHAQHHAAQQHAQHAQHGHASSSASAAAGGHAASSSASGHAQSLHINVIPPSSAAASASHAAPMDVDHRGGGGNAIPMHASTAIRAQ